MIYAPADDARDTMTCETCAGRLRRVKSSGRLVHILRMEPTDAMLDCQDFLDELTFCDRCGVETPALREIPARHESWCFKCSFTPLEE